MPSNDGADYAHLPQLLQASGAYFSAMVYVRNYLPPYSRSYGEAVTVGTNATAFATMGDPQEYIDSFTLEAWGAGAYRQVKEALFREDAQGLFTLRVPDLSDPATGDAYLVRFYEANMSRVYSRRKGIIQIFSADVTEIEVHGHEAY